MTLISCKNAFNSTYFLCYTYIALSFTTYAISYANLTLQLMYFKETEGGQAIMCKIVEDYAEKRKLEGLEEGRIKTIAEFLSNGGSETDAVKLLNASEKDLKKAKALLPV